jgi:hypothetical protein
MESETDAPDFILMRFLYENRHPLRSKTLYATARRPMIAKRSRLEIRSIIATVIRIMMTANAT